MELPSIGKALIAIGALLCAAGVLFLFAEKLGLGRLPGDIVVERRGVRVAFPIVTCLLVSLVLTILVNLWSRR